MKTNKEIRDKAKELLETNKTPLPEHELDTEKGISRLMMYFNKHSTDEMKEQLKTFLK